MQKKGSHAIGCGLLLLLAITAGCGQEFPVDELGVIHPEIPHVEGVEAPLKIGPQAKPAATTGPRRNPGRRANRVRIDPGSGQPGVELKRSDR